MSFHPLLPAQTELDALRDELRRTAEGLRRVARRLESSEPLPRADGDAPPTLQFVRGGRWQAAR